jgi:hypothetical protein
MYVRAPDVYNDYYRFPTIAEHQLREYLVLRIDKGASGCGLATSRNIGGSINGAN